MYQWIFLLFNPYYKNIVYLYPGENAKKKEVTVKSISGGNVAYFIFQVMWTFSLYVKNSWDFSALQSMIIVLR